MRVDLPGNATSMASSIKAASEATPGAPARSPRRVERLFEQLYSRLGEHPRERLEGISLRCRSQLLSQGWWSLGKRKTPEDHCNGARNDAGGRAAWGLEAPGRDVMDRVRWTRGALKERLHLPRSVSSWLLAYLNVRIPQADFVALWERAMDSKAHYGRSHIICLVGKENKKQHYHSSTAAQQQSC
eukprot:scaffold298_cov247-Pinguiococcus_pyrenoidosus.AAC.31